MAWNLYRRCSKAQLTLFIRPSTSLPSLPPSESTTTTTRSFLLFASYLLRSLHFDSYIYIYMYVYILVASRGIRIREEGKGNSRIGRVSGIEDKRPGRLLRVKNSIFLSGKSLFSPGCRVIKSRWRNRIVVMIIHWIREADWDGRIVGEIWSCFRKKGKFKNTKTGRGRVDLWHSHVMYAYDFVKLFILEYRQVINLSLDFTTLYINIDRFAYRMCDANDTSSRFSYKFSTLYKYTNSNNFPRIIDWFVDS